MIVHDFAAVAAEIEALRWKLLVDADDEKTGPRSKPHWFLAMAALESARWHFELAAVERAKELAGK